MGNLLGRIREDTSALAYVHCNTSVEYLEGVLRAVPGAGFYPERALLLARRNDVVCVADEVEPAFLDYLAELELGPDPSGIVVAATRAEARLAPLWKSVLENDDALGRLSHLMELRGATALHPFMATSGQFDLALTVGDRLGRKIRVLGGDPDLVAYADLKHHIRSAALELGVPVAPGEVVEPPADATADQRRQSLRAAIQRQARHTGRVILRGAAGAAGSATYLVAAGDTGERLAHRLGESEANRIYLVEAMVEATASPNIQLHIHAEDGTLECIGISDQRLGSDLVHVGNGHPSPARCLDEMVRWAGTLGRWLRDAGYGGIVGFDFVEYVDDRGQPRALLAEVNPRVNGATYPLALLERLGMSAFVSGTLDSELGTFAEMRTVLSDLLYLPGRSAGLVPYATGCLRQGKCPVVALASTRREAAELYAEAELVLEGACLAG
jgi:hypothetical protein